MARPFLEVQQEGETTRTPLRDEPLTIGRHPASGLIVRDDRASRHHCVVEQGGGGYQVRDLDSRNGTKLNGKPVGTGTLKPGDVIRIGKTELRFLSGDSEEDPLPLIEHDDESRTSPPQAERKAVSFGDGDSGNRSSVQVPDDEQRISDKELVKLARECEKSLHEIIASLPEPGFELKQVAMINARGKMVHRDTGKDNDSGREAVRLLRLLLMVCLQVHASDVHVEPKAGRFRVRIRVDGLMVDVLELHSTLAIRLLSLVKVLCDIDITQKSVVQEGHFRLQVPGRRIDFRVSLTPAVHGQKLVIRVLDLANSPMYVKDLGLPSWMEDTVNRTIRADSGMFIVCGPTGSGKTTSLYAALRDIDANQRNVITIEDPVEFEIDGVTQIPVNESHGNTFSSLLRSVLRQDPDVLLVGEIRDPETAQIALQAAVTGHLVLSTVHARDTIGAVFRLMDLGVEPYLVGTAVNVLLAQRLVRVLCPHCKVSMRPTSAQMMKMNKYAQDVSKAFFPCGCGRCLNTGYLGRHGVYELLTATDDLRDAILNNPTMQNIRKAVEGMLFNSLEESGYRLVAEGITSFDEIDRVISAGV